MSYAPGTPYKESLLTPYRANNSCISDATLLPPPPCSLQIHRMRSTRRLIFSRFHSSYLSILFSLSLQSSPLPRLRPRLTLIHPHRMQHDLIRIPRHVTTISLTPIITDRIRKNIALPAKSRTAYRAPDLRIALQSMLSVLIPEMECPVGSCSTECAVLWVE